MMSIIQWKFFSYQNFEQNFENNNEIFDENKFDNQNDLKNEIEYDDDLKYDKIILFANKFVDETKNQWIVEIVFHITIMKIWINDFFVREKFSRIFVLIFIKLLYMQLRHYDEHLSLIIFFWIFIFHIVEIYVQHSMYLTIVFN